MWQVAERGSDGGEIAMKEYGVKDTCIDWSGTTCVGVAQESRRGHYLSQCLLQESGPRKPQGCIQQEPAAPSQVPPCLVALFQRLEVRRTITDEWFQ